MADTDTLLEHEYDGIKEYDNPTPGWWHAIFIGTIIFSAFYALFFHGNPDAPSVHTTLEKAQLREIKRQFADLGSLTADEPTIARMMHEPRWLKVGESVFRSQCASCHGARGEGQVGPNLTDEYAKNIRSLPDIAKVVADGANQGAMPAWKNRLHPNEIVLVSSFVASLRGMNVPGRGAEGTEMPPWSSKESGAQ
jgi:cytochrome c oxidase cbb3-type subunit III